MQAPLKAIVAGLEMSIGLGAGTPGQIADRFAGPRLCVQCHDTDTLRCAARCCWCDWRDSWDLAHGWRWGPAR